MPAAIDSQRSRSFLGLTDKGQAAAAKLMLYDRVIR
jgi:hypothetical protein